MALTAEARASIGDCDELRIAKFPFKVGRECRTAPGAALRSEIERRLSRVEPLNDLFLLEPGALVFHISREHFSIEAHDGEYTLVDRDSAAGTIVADRRVGGEQMGGKARLRDGDIIVVGGISSPYVFRFVES